MSRNPVAIRDCLHRTEDNLQVFKLKMKEGLPSECCVQAKLLRTKLEKQPNCLAMLILAAANAP